MKAEQRLHLPRVLAAVAVCLLVLLCAATLYISVPFTGYGLVSAFCFHMCLQPRWRELLKVIAVSPVIFAVYVFLTVSRFRLLDVPAIFGILGLASFVIVGVRWS